MNQIKEINPRFAEFIFDWDSKVYFLFGGYGSSKSYHCALKIILKLLTERRTCLVVRSVFNTIRESCYSLIQEICLDLELAGVSFIRSPLTVNFPTGSRIIFRGLDDPAKLKSINDVSLIWVEEAAEISYAGYKELLGRLRSPDKKLYILLTTNPVSRSSWVYQHFFKLAGVDERAVYGQTFRAGDVYYHHSTADDNLFLPADYLLQLDELKAYDADLYRVARLGEFGTRGEKVLPQFEVQSSAAVMDAVNKIPARFKFCGMDFGFVESYNAVIRAAVDNDKKFLYIYWEYYANHMTDDETADALIEFTKTRELIRADSAEPKAISYYQKRGFRMTAAQKWNGGTRHARLDNTRKVKRFKRIICAADCVNTIRELSDLTFKQDKDGNVIEDEFNIDPHTFSALWYALDSYHFSDLKKITKADLGI